MKKTTAILTSIIMLASMSGLAVSAETDVIPVDVENTIYEQLLTMYGCDVNEDGIVTEQELMNVSSVYLNLNGVSDISWLTRLPNLNYLGLSNGDFTDLSFLADISTLTSLSFSSVPITDISFAKNMNLESFYLNDMDWITKEQQIDIMRFEDAVIDKGYSEVTGALPTGLLSEYDLKTTIENTDIACFDYTAEESNYGTANLVYGKNVGTTKYYVTADNEIIFSGNIIVNDTPIYSPELNDDSNSNSKVFESFYYGEHCILKNGTLYALKKGNLYKVEENVADMGYLSYKDDTEYKFSDLVLYNDGSIRINGELIETEGNVKFTKLVNNCPITANGELYYLKYYNNKFNLKLIADDFVSFTSDISTIYYISSSDEVVYISGDLDVNGEYSFTKINTGIFNPISWHNDYFVDKNNVLWEIVRQSSTIRKITTDVVYVGYRHYSNGMVYGCVHTKSDGTSYSAGTSRVVTLYEKPEITENFKASGKFQFDNYYSMANELSNKQNYHLSHDNELYLYYDGEKASISNVSQYVDCLYISETGEVIAYFLRTDGSLWQYSFMNDSFSELIPQELTDNKLMGDVNGDGEYNIADAVVMQKWLLNSGKLTNPENADMNDDLILDVFDLVLMKKALLES